MLNPELTNSLPAHAAGQGSEAAKGKSERIRLTVRSVVDLQNEPPKRWLIEGILGEGDVAVLTGKPGAGKTFLALAIAMAIAKGDGQFAGRYKVNGRREVVYACGEKRAGIPARVRAALEAELLGEDAPFYDASPLPQLFASESGMSVENFCEDLAQKVPRPGLIVIDTLNRATIGMDENSSAQMGVAIASVSQIADTLKTAVLLLHHPPKNDADGLRGSGALEAAVDTVLALVKGKGGRRWLRTTKQGDGEEFADISLDLVPDSSGSSLRVDWCSDVGQPRDDEPSGAKDRILSVLDESEWLTAREIVERSRVGFKTVRNALGALTKSKDVEKRLEVEGGKGSRSNLFVYRLKHPPCDVPL